METKKELKEVPGWLKTWDHEAKIMALGVDMCPFLCHLSHITKEYFVLVGGAKVEYILEYNFNDLGNSYFIEKIVRVSDIAKMNPEELRHIPGDH